MASRFLKTGLLSALILAPAIAHASIRLPLEFHRQERSLSCEPAALTMVLRYHGVQVTEAEVIRKMPMDKTPRQGDVWGDPDLGFVGDIDGVMGKTGYGIHWKPLARTAENWKKARVIENGSVAGLVAELDQRRPVIAWGIDNPAQELSWKTPKGRRVFALSEEHTRVVYGYQGDRKAPEGFHVMDTQHGPQFWKTDEFLKNWDSFGRKAIVLYP